MGKSPLRTKSPRHCPILPYSHPLRRSVSCQISVNMASKKGSICTQNARGLWIYPLTKRMYADIRLKQKKSIPISSNAPAHMLHLRNLSTNPDTLLFHMTTLVFTWLPALRPVSWRVCRPVTKTKYDIPLNAEATQRAACSNLLAYIFYSRARTFFASRSAFLKVA